MMYRLGYKPLTNWDAHPGRESTVSVIQMGPTGAAARSKDWPSVAL